MVALLAGCILPYPHTTPRSFEFSGRVIDARTKAPVRGVRVFLSEHPGTSCTTDAIGHFRLKATRNFHLARVSLGGDGFDWPFGKSFDVVTVSHRNYQTLQIDTIGFQGDILISPKP